MLLKTNGSFRTSISHLNSPGLFCQSRLKKILPRKLWVNFLPDLFCSRLWWTVLQNSHFIFCLFWWTTMVGAMWDFTAQRSTLPILTGLHLKVSYLIITTFNPFVHQHVVPWWLEDIQYTQVKYRLLEKAYRVLWDANIHFDNFLQKSCADHNLEQLITGQLAKLQSSSTS